MHCPKALTQIRQTFHDGIALLELPAVDLQSATDRLVDELVARGLVPPQHRAEVSRTLREREDDYPSAIGHGVAVPIAHLDFVAHPLMAFARLAEPLETKTPDDIPVRYVFLLLGKAHISRETDRHIRSVTTIARLMAHEVFARRLEDARDREELVAAIDGEAAYPEEKRPKAAEGLEWTGRMCGGVIDDVKRRWPHYIDDFKQGAHSKVLGAILFIFFACLAPTIAFGGLMSQLTDNHIGVVEMIMAVAAGGVVYALFSGQPLTILGGTGPLLIFTVVLYQQCKSLDLPFLPTYAWVGIWTGAFTIILALTDCCFLIRFCTRFTDEIFAALISIIYITEALRDIVGIFTERKVEYDIALLSLLLAIGTFWVSSKLKTFRNSRYLLAPIREFLADFGSVIAIGSMTAVAFYMNSVELETIRVPTEFAPTMPRDWMVSLFPAGLPSWVPFAAAIPALLGTLLVFMDQNITVRLVNATHFKLKKGPAYHLDLLIVGGLVGVLSIFGLPWLVAATVRSLNHVHALATVESVEVSRGNIHERISGVLENRVSGLVIHLLIGCSLLLVSVLKSVPMAALFGLFLYMGVTSLSANQFFERIKLWVMDPKLFPSFHYIRKVPTSTIHIFTFIQLLCLAALWLVKSSAAIAIFFPLAIALLVPLRLLLSRWFSERDLAILDSEEEPEEEQYLEVD